MQFNVSCFSLERFDTSSVDRTILRKYTELARVNGMGPKSPFSLPFNLREYEKQFFILGYDLTKAKRSSNYMSGVRGEVLNGNFVFEITYDNPLPKNVVMLVLSEFHSGVAFDKSRTAHYRYLS